MAFAPKHELLPLLGILNSRFFDFLLTVRAGKVGGVQYEAGLIQQTPVPSLSNEDIDVLGNLARRAWRIKQKLDSTIETSHAFVLPQRSTGDEAAPRRKYAGEVDRGALEAELGEIQREIDERVFALYEISAADRAAIQSAPKHGAISQQDDRGESEHQADDAEDSEEIPIGVPMLPAFSWFVGVAFGRFDKRLATGERPIPPEPEPFDPLPSRSPGMWPDGQARDLNLPDILVDDPGHDHDLGSQVAAATMNTGWPMPDDLRLWLSHEFFQLHIKMYSKSSRKAPIYWQLTTRSTSYSVWLYLHAFTKDTLYKVQNDYVAPKLAHEERRVELLRRELSESPNGAKRKTLAAQATFVDELRAFLDEVKRVAPLWNPDLDDGVMINFALLWRLVPHHKPWQKELKATWDALCSGDYDWAHLAMRLWPERVVPKCATDRSLAIAHGLEEEFWVEGSDGRWTSRTIPLKSVAELVRERNSPAVKAALKSLLDAPTSSGKDRDGGRRAAFPAATEGVSR